MDRMMDADKPSGRIIDYNLKEELEHGIYVSRLAAATAQEMKLSAEEVHNIRLAGLVHDVGKLRLKEDMKDPEGERFITAELKYVRDHTRQSYEWLKEKGFSEEILNIVRNHHENFDGTGYPNKLAWGAIPMGARILRVCDVFAALTSDRPYRKRFSKEDAMQMMIQEAVHYDMQVFLAFQRVIHRVDVPNQYIFKEGDFDGID